MDASSLYVVLGTSRDTVRAGPSCADTVRPGRQAPVTRAGSAQGQIDATMIAATASCTAALHQAGGVEADSIGGARPAARG